MATGHIAALAAVLGLTVAELTEGCTAAPVAAPVAPKAPVAAPVLPERKYGRRGQYRWRGNINPACHRGYRCGECVKDKSAESARQKWANGAFLRGTQNRYNNWSKQEIELVRHKAGTARPLEIIEALRTKCRSERSLPALKKVAWVHGIPLGRAGYGMFELGRFFGVNPDTVRFWIESGVLEATRWGVLATTTRGAWSVSRPAVETFIRTRPWLYDFGVMDRSHPLYAVAAVANRGERWVGTKELAKLLGLRSTQYVSDLAVRGVLPCEFRGTIALFRETDVREMREIMQTRREAHLARLRMGPVRRAIAA